VLVGSVAEEIQRAGKRLPVGARDEVRASFYPFNGPWRSVESIVWI
jgi:hypothetical protein